MKRTAFTSLMIIFLIMNLGSCQFSKKSDLGLVESKENKDTIKIKDDMKEDKQNETAQENKSSKDVAQKVSQVSAPEWAKDAVIYEVNVRQYTKEGTFKAFEQHLPRLKELGLDVLWFMPIHPISEVKRNGTLGSYYSVKDYKDVNPEYGTLEEFKQLVNKCHEMGFKVLLDWVANHTGWDNPWIKNNPDWYTHNVKGEIIHPPGTDWTDVADLNYDNRDMRDAMLDAMKFWVEEVQVDGFRADYAGGVPTDFWEMARSELDKIKPVFMLAEDDRVLALLDKAFNVNYGWELYNIMNKIAKGQNNAKHVEMHLTKIQNIYPKGTYPMYFTSNHDENSWNGTEYERLGDAVKTMAVLTFTAPGIPLIYSGQEAGLNRRLAFFEKDEIDWNDLTMQEFYKDLITLKKENPALWNGEYGGQLKIFETSNKSILAFERSKDGNKVITIINLSAEACSADITIGDAAGEYRSFFTQEVFNLSNKLMLDLEPWEYIVLTFDS